MKIPAQEIRIRDKDGDLTVITNGLVFPHSNDKIALVRDLDRNTDYYIPWSEIKALSVERILINE